MGEFSFGELLVIVVIAIVIYGKDLPQAARKLAHLYTKLRRQLGDIRDEIQRQIPPEELSIEAPRDPYPAATEPPPIPTGLKATPEPGQVYLTWNASPGATSYVVRRAPAGGDPFTTVASGVVGTGYTDTGVAPGVTYSYVVVAANSAGESAWSDEVQSSARAADSAPPASQAAPPPVEASSGTLPPEPGGNGSPEQPAQAEEETRPSSA
jgi:Sec-independent protein translocase protein TatA